MFRLIRLKDLTGINLWTTLASPPVALLREATAGDLSRNLLWRDLLSMFLSEHTVQDHLKSIFAKTAAHSRRALLSLMLGR